MNTLLVVAPHADDAELGAGGYIAKCKEMGWKVGVTILCSTNVKRYHAKEVTAATTRTVEAEAAAQLLGLDMLDVLHYPEGDVYSINLAELVGRLDDRLDAFAPSEVLIPLTSSNQDHDLVWRACLAALRPSKLKTPTRVLAYEIPHNCWGPTHLQGPIQGKVYVPLSEAQMARKMAALACHHSQIEGRETTLAGLAGARNLALMRGVECGATYGELFYLLREIMP